MALQKSGFELKIMPLESLHPHEQTIPSHVEELALECRRDGVQKDPVLIDSKSGSVLDGMHRLAAFRRLELKNVICCSLDYSSVTILVSRWARVYSGAKNEALLKAARAAGLTRTVSVNGALEELEVKGAGLAAITVDEALMSSGRIGIKGGFSAVRMLDVAAEAAGWHRGFVPEEGLREELNQNGTMVVIVEKISKGDVLEAATSGHLFPCKTSMHVIDPRPVAVNFPIAELNSASSSRIAELISKTGGRLLPANSVYEGRRYKERLLLLN